MDRRALFGGALALALAGATVLIAPTTAATSGTGTSTLSTELLSIEIGQGGELLGLTLVGEEVTTSNGSTPSAVARLHSASLGSDVVSQLNAAGPTYEVASSSASSPATLSAPAVDLASLAGQALPSGVLAGRVVPRPLTAAVDAAGAHASGGAAVEGLSLAGGLVSSGALSTSIGSDSISTASSSARSVVAQNLRVLDLGALLAGLGIDPAELSLETLTKLVTSLKLEVPGVPAEEEVGAVINELTGQIETLVELVPVSSLQAQQLGGLVGGVVDPLLPGGGGVGGVIDPVVDPVVDPIVDDVDDALGGLPVPNVPLDEVIDLVDLPGPIQDVLDDLGLGAAPTVEEVLQRITELQTELSAVITGTVETLAAAPLLSVDSIEISASSKAGDAVATSLADVTAKVGGIHIGELGSFTGIDVTDLSAPATVAQLDALAAAIEGEIAKVLGQISPALAGIVDIKLFEETESVTQTGSTLKSVASLTAITASVTPPSDLAGIVDGILATVGVTELLQQVDVEVPTVEDAMTLLNGLLAGVSAGEVSAQQVPDIGALADGVTVRLGTLAASSTFTPTPASVPTPNNPTAGSPSVPTGTSGPGAPSAPGDTGAPTELPRTGSSLTFMLLAFGALLIATGLGLPQWAEAAVNSRGSRHTN